MFVLLFSLSALCVSVQPPASQVNFFRQICANTNVGDFSSNSNYGNWCNFGASVCLWQFVNCANIGGVETVTTLQFETLDSPDDLLIGTLPSSFAPLPDLVSFVLTASAMTFQFGPNTFSSNSALAILVLSLSPVTGNFTFDYLPASVQELTIAYTEISGTISGNFARVRHLNTLQIQGHKFTGTLAGGIFLETNLTNLLIQNTLIGGALPAEMCLSFPVFTDLTDNRFTHRPDCLVNIISDPPKLCFLQRNLFCVGPLASDGYCEVDSDPVVGILDKCGVCSGNGLEC